MATELTMPKNDMDMEEGTIVKWLKNVGDKVEKGQPLLITEAMKMETTIEARFAGTVDHIYVEEGEAISSGDLLLEVKEK